MGVIGFTEESTSHRALPHRLRNLRQRLRRKTPPASDPQVERLAPIRRGPKGRSGAAVAERDEYS